MKIFITGGTGFIGKFVVEKLLKKNHKLLLLSRNPKSAASLFGEKKQITVLRGNLSNIKKLQNQIQSFKPDAAIHLAWEGIPDARYETSLKNLMYGLNLIEVLNWIGCKKIIYVGSCAEYGNQTGKINEDAAIQPLSALYAAKLSLFWLCKRFSEENDIEFIWTRPFYVYGPGQRQNSLIPYIIQCVKNKESPQIKNLNGANDFVYVEDVADALVKITERHKKPQSNIYNIGSSKLTSIAEIMKLSYGQFNKSLDIKIKTPRKITGLYADISKISKEIDWKPKTDIKTGIRKTINYFAK